MRLLLWALWLAVLATLLSGCRKPSVSFSETAIQDSGIYIPPGEKVISDGITTCELLRDQSGHVYEKSGISLGRCFSIWMTENAEQDHYEEWFHKKYGPQLSQEGCDEAKKHLLGRS